jgi:hypothetical protein
MYFLLSRPYNFLQNRSHFRPKDLANIKYLNACIFPGNNGIKLETNSKGNYRNYKSTWRLSKILLNYQYVFEEIKDKIKND